MEGFPRKLNIEEGIIRRRGRHGEQEVDGKVERMTDQVWKQQRTQSAEENRQEERYAGRGGRRKPHIQGSVCKQNREGRVKPKACLLPLELKPGTVAQSQRIGKDRRLEEKPSHNHCGVWRLRMSRDQQEGAGWSLAGVGRHTPAQQGFSLGAEKADHRKLERN